MRGSELNYVHVHPGDGIISFTQGAIRMACDSAPRRAHQVPGMSPPGPGTFTPCNQKLVVGMYDFEALKMKRT